VPLRLAEWPSLELYACSVCSQAFADPDWCEAHEQDCVKRLLEDDDEDQEEVQEAPEKVEVERQTFRVG
jgi:hypothetical protein